MRENWYVLIFVFILSVASTGNMLGAFLKAVTRLTILVLYLELYFYAIVISTMVSLFGVFSTSGIIWGCTSGVSALIFLIFIFGKSSFFLV